MRQTTVALSVGHAYPVLRDSCCSVEAHSKLASGLEWTGNSLLHLMEDSVFPLSPGDGSQADEAQLCSSLLIFGFFKPSGHFFPRLTDQL